MYRTLMENLIEWKNNPGKKPLILQGVRQCGKTYLLKEFGSLYYEDVFYCRFDDNTTMAGFFEQDLDPRRIVKEMSIFRNKDIKPAKTLIILDEIQFCGKALSALKNFYEDAPEYHVIAVGSLLGVAVPKGTSFSVGKTEFLKLYPMDFYEFLLAHNRNLADHLKNSPAGDRAWAPFTTQLTEIYRDYLIVGGMPEAVQNWLDNKSIENVEKIHSQIIISYENDFVKHAPISYFPKISAVMNAVPSQLAKENRKFIFSQVKKSWRAKDLEDALEWLVRAGLVYKAENIEKPYFPVSAYANHTYFKLYMADVGLLRRMANLPAAVLMDKTDNYKEFKGAMAENYICCELKKIYGDNIYYWTADAPGKAEVDFIIQDGTYIVPVEVKAGTVSRTYSLNQYIKLYNPEKTVVTSLDHDKPGVLPLYMFWNLKEWMKTR